MDTPEFQKNVLWPVGNTMRTVSICASEYCASFNKTA